MGNHVYFLKKFEESHLLLSANFGLTIKWKRISRLRKNLKTMRFVPIFSSFSIKLLRHHLFTAAIKKIGFQLK